jgi:septal ring factor EnvC (AmiA/AmiB activator)
MATRRKKTDVEAALVAVKEADVKKVLDQVGTVQTNVQGTLAALGVTMTEKIEELRSLETAIDARKQELADIHEIEVEADTLDEIKEKVKDAEEDAKERRQKRSKERNEEAEERQAAWQREQEEHTYQVAQRDKRDEEALAAQSEERQRVPPRRAGCDGETAPYRTGAVWSGLRGCPRR